MDHWTHTHASRLAIGTGLALCLAVGFAAAEQSSLTIKEYGVGTDIVDRELKGKNDQFEEGSRIVFLTRVIGGVEGDRIRHVWFHEKEEIVSIGLTLGGSHWRTFSRKTMHPGSTGAWVVEARDSEDRVLARVEFTCVPVGSGDSRDPEGP
jgi:hypothetical protein